MFDFKDYRKHILIALLAAILIELMILVGELAAMRERNKENTMKAAEILNDMANLMSDQHKEIENASRTINGLSEKVETLETKVKNKRGIFF